MTTELLAQLDRVADFVNEATVAVNERSRDALYKQGLDALGDIDKMRKLLEEPASEDAWLVEADRLINELAGSAIGMYAEELVNARHDLRAHLRARPAKDVARPINTAPRDGTAILLGARCGWWIGKWLPVYGSGFKPDCPWSSLMLNHDHMTEKREAPTHWLPLPAAMIEASKESGK